MLTGIALAVADVPLALIEQEHLEPRRVERGGEAELQFLFRDAERLLPVWNEGRLQLVRWGNRRGESRAHPLTGWARLETFEGGCWGRWRPVEVFIPATLGLDGRVWYGIRQGVRGQPLVAEAVVLHLYPSMVSAPSRIARRRRGTTSLTNPMICRPRMVRYVTSNSHQR
jgi:hypothetical protein